MAGLGDKRPPDSFVIGRLREHARQYRMPAKEPLDRDEDAVAGVIAERIQSIPSTRANSEQSPSSSSEKHALTITPAAGPKTNSSGVG